MTDLPQAAIHGRTASYAEVCAIHTAYAGADMTILPRDPAYQDPIEVAWRTIEDLRERLTDAEAENAILRAELRETSRRTGEPPL